MSEVPTQSHQSGLPQMGRYARVTVTVGGSEIKQCNRMEWTMEHTYGSALKCYMDPDGWCVEPTRTPD